MQITTETYKNIKESNNVTIFNRKQRLKRQQQNVKWKKLVVVRAIYKYCNNAQAEMCADIAKTKTSSSD